MEVNIKYFGAVAEAAELTEEVVKFQEDFKSVSDLKTFCENKYERMSALSYQISINKKLTSDGIIADGDEVAFLPPFAGG